MLHLFQYLRCFPSIKESVSDSKSGQTEAAARGEQFPKSFTTSLIAAKASANPHYSDSVTIASIESVYML